MEPIFYRVLNAPSYRRSYSTQLTQKLQKHSTQQEPWLQQKAPNGFWKIKENQIEYMNWLGQKLNITTMEDWYNLSFEDITQNHGGTLIKYYKNSHMNLIKSVYPNYKWLPWKFNHVPRGYWKDENNVKEYMNWLSEKLNIKSMEDWYKVTQKDIVLNHGKTLIQYSNNESHVNLITSSYPNYNWLPWKFNHTPLRSWKSENIKEYMNWLSEKLSIKTMEDWYKVSREDILQNYGGSLIMLNNNSHIDLIKSAYPNYKWLTWKFNQVPKGYWNDTNNVKEYMNWLSEQLNIKTMEDWYNVIEKDIIQNYGGGLINITKSSNKHTKLQEILQTIYPEYKWDVFKFSQVPNRYVTYLLENPSEQKEFVNYLEKKFNIKQIDDWHSLTKNQLKKVVSIDLKSVMKIVKQFYPEINDNKG